MMHFAVAASLPKHLKHKFEQGKISRLVADIIKDAVDQTVFEFQANFFGWLLDRAKQFWSLHRAKVHYAVLWPIGEGTIAQHPAIEVAA